MNIEYKIYTEILRQRLVKELEKKECLAYTQMGYSPGRGTMDAVYVLKTGVQNEIRKDKGKAYVLFAYVTGGFDRATREELWKMIEMKGIVRQLRIRIMELYEKTSCRILKRNKTIGRFRTRKEVRQGCPLSAVLFNIFLKT